MTKAPKARQRGGTHLFCKQRQIQSNLEMTRWRLVFLLVFFFNLPHWWRQEKVFKLSTDGIRLAFWKDYTCSNVELKVGKAQPLVLVALCLPLTLKGKGLLTRGRHFNPNLEA